MRDMMGGGKKEFSLNLNFIIHFIIAAELFAINNFNISHIIGLGIMMFFSERGADG